MKSQLRKKKITLLSVFDCLYGFQFPDDGLSLKPTHVARNKTCMHSVVEVFCLLSTVNSLWFLKSLGVGRFNTLYQVNISFRLQNLEGSHVVITDG